MNRRRSIASVRRGLTLLELMIAVSITAIAGLALTTVMTTVARSITSSAGSRSALQRAHAAYIRLRAFTDPGLCLLQHDPARGFALWLEDTTPGGSVNLREVRVFWFSADSGTITMERVEFPGHWPKDKQIEHDVPLSPGANFLNEMEHQRSLGCTRTETLCDGMIGLSLAYDHVSAQKARKVWITLTMDDSTDDPPQILTSYAFMSHREPK